MTKTIEELGKKIIAEYEEKTVNDEELIKLIEKCMISQSYMDAYPYASKVGKIMESLIISEWEFDGNVYFGSIVDLLISLLPKLNADITSVCDFIQFNKNKTLKKLKTQTVNFYKGDAIFIAEEMVGKGITSLQGYIENYAQNVVDDNLELNARFHNTVNYKIKIIRIYDRVGLRAGTKYSENCKFCVDREGTFIFDTFREARDSGVFQRHVGCKCRIDYECPETRTNIKNIQNYNQPNKNKLKNNKNNQSKKKIVLGNIEKMRQHDIIKKTYHGEGARISYERQKSYDIYSEIWGEGSLRDVINRFVKDPVVYYTESGKIIYYSKQSQYMIVYDREFDYFRIKQITPNCKARPYVNMNGNVLVNDNIDGKHPGIPDEEYEMRSHFRNTDWR